MPKKNNEIDILEIILMVVKILGTIGLVYFLIWAYFNAYKPKERMFNNNSNYAYKIIQDEVLNEYKKNGFVYDVNNQIVDKVCENIHKKYGKRQSNCTISSNGVFQKNFVFKKKNIAVYGLEKPVYEVDGTFVKDFYIDVNNDKGDNIVGVDILPLRIYSAGRLGGMVTPVNCKHEDLRDYGLSIAKTCQNGVEINFLDMKKPIAYTIWQIGGDHGRNRQLGRNMSLLRADCKAFGSELFNAEEYCDKRGYSWLTACYHEYFCSVERTTK